MSLLTEIRDGAIDSQSDLGQVLRKCLVLSTRLHYPALREWARKELDGYKPDDDLPDYRIFSASSVGTFDNGVKHYPNLPIPDLPYTPEERDLANKASIRQGINSLSSLVGKDNLTFAWPDWMIRKWHRNMYHTYACLNAHVIVPPGSVESILNAIRNRLVDFCLSIEEEFPGLEEQAETVPQSPAQIAKVDHLYQTIIQGQDHVISLGSNTVSVQQIAKQVVAGDLSSLHRFLQAEGFAEDDLPELDEALKDPNAVEEAKEDRGPIATWAGKAASKVAKGAGGIIFETAKQLAIKAALHYAGMG